MMIFFFGILVFFIFLIEKKSNLVENKCWLIYSCLMYIYFNVYVCIGILLYVLVIRGIFYYFCD